MKLITVTSDNGMQACGVAFSKKLKKGDTVFLYGDLGFGKTTFVKGVAKGLGVTSRIISPTFPIIRKYDGFYHIDLYRIEGEKQLQELGIYEVLEDKNVIKLIEWPEKLRDKVSDWKIMIQMDKSKKSVQSQALNTRTLEIKKISSKS